MKRWIAVLAGVSVMAGMIPVMGYSADVPVEFDEAVMEMLKENNRWSIDRDNDGVFSAEEVASCTQLDVDLTGITDISWLAKFEGCRYITFSGDYDGDFSVLAEMPLMRNMEFYAMPFTDISFLKKMHNVETCRFRDMEQITLAQRVDALSWSDHTIQQGYSEVVAVSPIGLLDPYKVEFSIEDTSVCDYMDNRYGSYGQIQDIYGVAPGTTKYHVIADGQEVVSGSITVTPIEVYAPPLSGSDDSVQIFHSFYYGDTFAVLKQGTLYGIRGGEMTAAFTDVADFDCTYKKNSSGDYMYYDLVLKQDGTLIINDVTVENRKFSDLQNGMAIAEDGTLYGIYPQAETPVLVRIGGNFSAFPYSDNYFYINTSGEVIRYAVSYTNSKPVATTQATGIRNPVSTHYNLFVDGDGVLWKTDGYRSASKTMVAKDVVETGQYYDTTGGLFYGYIAKDGTCHMVSNQKEVKIAELVPVEYAYHEHGSFYIHEYDAIYGNGNDMLIYWFRTAEDVLTIDFFGNHSAISDVETVIGDTYDADAGLGYAWFIRKDGSVWRYCFEEKSYQNMTDGQPAETETESGTESPTEPQFQKGDVNEDGKVNAVDAVQMQKFLFGVASGSLKTESDLNGDGVVDAFDLALLKRMLLARA